ncbi:MAG: hypothetical protein NT074_07915, partial [Methanomicrobiales archaeon]|nr:hypothetical protein [Methanomicrobiales archaeon]
MCVGFIVHHPYRLNPNFEPSRIRAEDELFSGVLAPSMKEEVQGISEQAYLPAIEALLQSIDAGFKCAFSISGVVAEQLAEWSLDVLAQLTEVAKRPGVEFLGQTYYHSIAAYFTDSKECIEQVRIHKDLMRDLFHVRPQVCETTETLLTPHMARAASDLGFSALYTEGVERLMGERSPNILYSYRDLPLMVKNCRLSDDIVHRAGEIEWDQYPLTPDKFAEWIARSDGTCVHIFLDLSLCRRHRGRDNRLLEFIRGLPSALDARGVKTVMPHEVATQPTCGELLHPGGPSDVIGHGVSDGLHTWLQNMMQHSAVGAVARAGPLIREKRLWRVLQTSDYFHGMALRAGECGRSLRVVTHEEARTSFESYIGILSACEELGNAGIRGKKGKREAAWTLRVVPSARAFHFTSAHNLCGLVAHSLDEFLEMMEFVPDEVIAFHLASQDFPKWIMEVLEDHTLAEDLARCSDRADLVRVLAKRTKELWT